MSVYTPNTETQEFLQQFTVAELEKQGGFHVLLCEEIRAPLTGLDASARDNI